MDDLRDRVAALERALSDGEGDLTALAEGAATADRVTDLEGEVESLRDEVDELAAATQALRGYVGNVRSVNESVEDRADAAAAAVESLEDRVNRLESAGSRPTPDERTRSDRDGPEHGGPVAASDHCRACGRPTETGSATGAEPANHRKDDPPGGGAPSTTVGSFDPDAVGGRVRVRRDGGPEPQAADSEATADGPDEHLLDRIRSLL